MSRSWFFFGLVAFATAVGFAGCTVTTDTGGGAGGSGGNGGDASGGATNEGGTTSEGGATNGGTDQGGTSSQGGTGGQSSTVTETEAITKLCAIAGVATCIGSTPCPDYFKADDEQFPNCIDKHTVLYDCLSKLPASAFTCGANNTPLYTGSCTAEDTAYLDCAQ